MRTSPQDPKLQNSKYQKVAQKRFSGHCLRTPNPYNFSKKYSNTPPICTAVRPPSVTLCLAGFPALKQGNAAIHLQFVLQYASYFYRSTPPICTGNTSGKIPVVGGSGKFLILSGLTSSKQRNHSAEVVPKLQTLKGHFDC